ncbi:stage III sporulation protein AF [Maledivibacter halophilus]|nr:stage III sporulation protein AF [Maledivibacter halophilus]
MKIWIKTIVTVIILVSFLEMLMPEGKMKKYLNLILGFIIMLIILNPIISILNTSKNLENEVFKLSSEISRKEYAFSSSNIEKKQKNQLEELYKNRIKQDIVYRIESKYDVKIDKVNMEIEEITEDSAGKIKKLELIVNSPGEELKEDTVPIVKIDISDNENSKDIKEDSDINIGLKEKIKEDISDIYNLKDSNIIITN